MKIQRLHCQAGDHDWDRRSQRGRAPTSCPKHSQPRQVAVRVVETSVTGTPRQVHQDATETPETPSQVPQLTPDQRAEQLVFMMSALTGKERKVIER